MEINQQKIITGVSCNSNVAYSNVPRIALAPPLFSNQMQKICGIYKITSPSKKIYIGQSVNILQRIYCYKGLHCNKQQKLHASILKHGWENHTFEIIHKCVESELNQWEIYYINFYQSYGTKHGMNLKEGGGSIAKLSEEIKQKIRKKRALQVMKPRTIKTKEKMSKSQKGNTNSLGVKHTKEFSDNIKERFKIKGHPRGMLGKHHTKEWKANNGLRMIGNTINKGRRASDETKEKMKLARREYLNNININK